MDVYAPLADRFGMGAIKVELEDLSFSYLMPEECRRLQSLIEPKQEERMGLLKKAMCHKLEIALKDAGIKAEVSGRRKHIYSIYRKLNIKKVGLNEIYRDLVALRIIVDTVQDCYGALSALFTRFGVPSPAGSKITFQCRKPTCTVYFAHDAFQ